MSTFFGPWRALWTRCLCYVWVWNLLHRRCDCCGVFSWVWNLLLRRCDCCGVFCCRAGGTCGTLASPMNCWGPCETSPDVSCTSQATGGLPHSVALCTPSIVRCPYPFSHCLFSTVFCTHSLHFALELLHCPLILFAFCIQATAALSAPSICILHSVYCRTVHSFCLHFAFSLLHFALVLLPFSQYEYTLPTFC